MASYAYTFNSGDGVTPTRLNAARTISDIVNADIKSDAAIAGTKIAPNFGSQNISTNGTITASNANAGVIVANRTSASANQIALQNSGVTNGFIGATASALASFSDGTGSEKVRITSDGAVCIGTDASIDAFNGTDTGTTISGGAAVISRSDNTALRIRRVASDGAVVGFNRSGVTTSVGIISVSTTSTNYGTTSDYRLKENPQPMTDALSRLSEVKPVTFSWKSNGQQSDGFIAHELQAVVPEAVTGTKDAVDANGNPEYQNVDASKIVPLLVAAVQELSAKVAALEAAQ